MRDYEIIGLSYYWAWHKPTTISEAGKTIERLKNKYHKEVIIFETGYIWTTASNDQASNIISEVHQDYAPASPDAQYRWLHDLTQEVASKGGLGVIYWEPAWVSSPCFTQWGKGSHQEHAAFFDFSTKALNEGGFKWLNEGKSLTVNEVTTQFVHIDTISKTITNSCCQPSISMKAFSTDGKLLLTSNINYQENYVFPSDLHGQIILQFENNAHNNVPINSEKIWLK